MIYTLMASCQEQKSNTQAKCEWQIYTGSFSTFPFVDKGGRVHQNFPEWYFVCNDIRYFVKFSESNINTLDLISIEGKEIRIEGLIKQGLWDNEGNEQSRIGSYIIINKILTP